MTCAKMLPPPWRILAMSPFQVAQLHWGPLISLATDQTLVRAFGQDNRHEWVVSASRSQVSQQFHGRPTPTLGRQGSSSRETPGRGVAPVHRLAAGARRAQSPGGRHMAEQGSTRQMSRRKSVPDENGFFGEYGGQFLPPQLEGPFAEITKAYHEIENDAAFIAELRYLRKHFQGRPTPVYHARTLSLENGGAQIYLKREDLNHTGAHKLNHCMGEGLLAKYLGKKKVIAETGAGQHGVALATAAAHFGLECEIHMGQVDIEKQAPNVSRMQLLGATVVPVTHGLRTLKEAVDSAFEAYLADYENSIYCIGSVVGPHPFPLMVRDFQRVVGIEAREEFHEMTGNPVS